IGDRTLRPVAETYAVSELIVQDDLLSEDLPFGTRSGVAVRHYFPLHAYYTLKIRLQRATAGTGVVRTLSGWTQQIHLQLGPARATPRADGASFGARLLLATRRPARRRSSIHSRDGPFDGRSPAATRNVCSASTPRVGTAGTSKPGFARPSRRF